MLAETSEKGRRMNAGDTRALEVASLRRSRLVLGVAVLVALIVTAVPLMGGVSGLALLAPTSAICFLGGSVAWVRATLWQQRLIRGDSLPGFTPRAARWQWTIAVAGVVATNLVIAAAMIVSLDVSFDEPDAHNGVEVAIAGVGLLIATVPFVASWIARRIVAAARAAGAPA
jgi:hypothetical protein